MLDSKIRKAFEAKKHRGHTLSMLMVFNPFLILSPIVGRRLYWEFEEGNLEYQDIYIFGFRVIRWQL